MTELNTRHEDNGEFKIGARTRRRETERFIRGAGTYVDDIQLTDQLYAAFVRTSLAHATIQSINTEIARSMPGVVAVVTAKDLVGALQPSRGSGSAIVANLTSYPLPHDKVRHVGEAVAVVVAESRYQAQDAADAVQVEYEPLPVVVDPERALTPESAKLFEELPTGNIVQEIHFATDGVEDVFASADHVISARLRTHRFTACPLEGRASLAAYDPVTGELTVWCSSAGVHSVRGKVSSVLGMPETRVRVIAPDVGGSFGAKNGTYPEEVLLSYLARRLRRPVKWAETRMEHLATAKQGRDQTHYVEAAVRADGRILGLRDRIIADLGAASSVDNSLSSAVLYMTGSYDIQCYKVDGYGVATNKAAHGSLRGIGKADAAFVLERLVNIIARQLGLDPAEVRLKNFVPEDAFPYRTATGAVLDSGRYHTCLKKALEIAGYDQLRKQQVELRQQGIWRGIGISFVIEPTGAARRRVGGGYGTCRIRVEQSGRVSVFPSLGAQGQGHETTITQIVADRLGVAADVIDVFEADTAVTPYGFGTGSSRSSVVLMPAVYVAAEMVREKLLRIAAHRLEVDPADLVLRDGQVQAAGTSSRSMGLREIAQIAFNDVDRLPPDLEPTLEVTGHFVNPSHIYEPDEKGRRNEFAAYPYEAVVAVVDVDLATGDIQIVKYVSVHDCGTMLNPRIVQTQHLGCIAQGLGAALYEELQYNDEGQLVNSTFMDYLLPTVNEIPSLMLDHLETPTPFTPLGAKGAGETGTLSPPPALGNAIEDALAPLNVQIRETPYTPPRLLKLIKAARSGDGVQTGAERVPAGASTNG